MLFKKYKSSLKSYIHTETQDGKGSIDAHFTVAMRHVLKHVNMGSNVTSPMELCTTLQSNDGVGNTVVAVFDLDQPFIDEFFKKHIIALEFFSKIKCCNEIIYSDKSVVVCECSGVNGTKVEMDDPTNPIGELPSNAEMEEDSDADSKEETEEDNIVYDLEEEEECDEEFADFRGNLTSFTFTTEFLRARQMRKRVQHNSTATATQDGSTIDEFVTRIEENELVSVT